MEGETELLGEVELDGDCDGLSLELGEMLADGLSEGDADDDGD